MKEIFKNYLRKSFLYDFLHPAIQKRRYKKWLESGRSGAAPSLETQRVVKEYGQKFGADYLIETGTFRGEMVRAQLNNFTKIYSIELNEALAKKASKRLSRYGHVRIYQGDSSEILPEILDKVGDGKALFWLDAHYSGGITSKGKEESPIVHELEIIFEKTEQNIVLLIDDARNFTGNGGYPTIDELKVFVQSKRQNWVFDLKDDIIRIHPPR